MQTPPHSVASADATTQLPLTEFLLVCIYSKDPLDRSVPPPTHAHTHSASLPQPCDIATINSLSSTSCTSGRHVCTPASRVRLHSAPLPPPSLQVQAPMSSLHGILVKAAPVRPRSQLALAFTSSGASFTSTSSACALKHPYSHVLLYNVVAKKRDAPTDLLRRLHGYMHQHNVDPIGGDFNMGAFSTVGDFFSDPEFAAPGNSLLWGLGGLDETCRECMGFIIMPRHPHTWRVQSHGCYTFDNAELGFRPRDQTAHLPVFLHLRTTNLPGPDSIMRSEHAQQRGFERRHNRQERRKRRRG